ncbi:MAG: DUF4160 domain-containing protein [Verrucomicrobia bacterium]|nr:DUF4160 domain-containing protein [Verrucomicrobiota bacterium]
MPVLSKFYGIVIRMLTARALTPRFHALYGGAELIVEIPTLRIINGSAPLRVVELVLEWAAQHQRELMEAWNRSLRALPPPPIAPLQ